jgi:hypothetical protein
VHGFLYPLCYWGGNLKKENEMHSTISYKNHELGYIKTGKTKAKFTHITVEPNIIKKTNLTTDATEFVASVTHNGKKYSKIYRGIDQARIFRDTVKRTLNIK